MPNTEEPFGTLSSTPVLLQRTSATSMMRLRGTRQQAMHLPLDFSKEEDAHMWATKQRELLDVGLGWFAALLNLETTYNDKLWMPGSWN